MSIPQLPNLILTCSSKSWRMGIESLLKKIYTVYALARFLDVSYFHSPLLAPLREYPSLFAKNASTAETIEYCNKLFCIASDVKLPHSYHQIHQPVANLDFLCDLRDRAKNSTSCYIVDIISARSIAERHLEMLSYVKDISPFEPKNSFPFKIAMHVRQGDLLQPELALSNSFYIKTALQISEILKELHIPFICELYLEIATTNSRMESSLQAQMQEVFINEFDVLPGLKKFINTDPLNALQSLATADLIIMSRYSLSYVAAMLSKKGMIVHHPFLEHPLPKWIDATHTDLLSEKIKKAVLELSTN